MPAEGPVGGHVGQADELLVLRDDVGRRGPEEEVKVQHAANDAVAEQERTAVSRRALQARREAISARQAARVGQDVDAVGGEEEHTVGGAGLGARLNVELRRR